MIPLAYQQDSHFIRQALIVAYMTSVEDQCKVVNEIRDQLPDILHEKDGDVPEKDSVILMVHEGLQRLAIVYGDYLIIGGEKTIKPDNLIWMNLADMHDELVVRLITTQDSMGMTSHLTYGRMNKLGWDVDGYHTRYGMTSTYPSTEAVLRTHGGQVKVDFVINHTGVNDMVYATASTLEAYAHWCHKFVIPFAQNMSHYTRL